MPERRHRLTESEIPEVVLGLRLRLRELLQERREPEKAETTLHCMHRLLEEKPGRPNYPKFSWEHLESLVGDDQYYIFERLASMKQKQTTKKDQT